MKRNYAPVMAMPPHLISEQRPMLRTDGRSRKKQETRLAIQDAALELFVDQGYEATTVEQIAARAQVSPATFFRHFESKSQVIFNDPDRGLPALWHAIIDHPDSGSDLEAIRDGVQGAWVARIDPERAARQAQAIEKSPLLRGLSDELGLRWAAVISDALARRRRLQIADEHCELSAQVALAVFGKALDWWLQRGPHGDLAVAVDHAFDAMTNLCAEWHAPSTIRR